MYLNVAMLLSSYSYYIIFLYLGDCSEQKGIEESGCRFTHPWISDSANLFNVEDLGLVHGIDLGLRRTLKTYAMYCVFSIVIIILSFKICKKSGKKE